MTRRDLESKRDNAREDLREALDVYLKLLALKFDRDIPTPLNGARLAARRTFVRTATDYANATDALEDLIEEEDGQ